jgi:hypothetical protein
MLPELKCFNSIQIGKIVMVTSQVQNSKVRIIRIGLLFFVVLNLIMIMIRVTLYPQVLAMPGGMTSVVELVVLLIVYAVFGVAATKSLTTHRRTSLLVGTVLGIVSGFISVAHIVQENYVDLPARATANVTWIFILMMFLPWGVAGFRAARQTGEVGLGVFAAVWSAIVCMLLTLSFGFGQLLLSLSRLEQRDATSPDFFRSGWTDLRAFVIADLFQAGFTHLLLGPVIGSILGGAAAILAVTISKHNNAGA